MSTLPELLAPFSSDLPCGVDPSVTMTLSELEVLVRREISMVNNNAPLEPEWKVVEAEALAAAQASKDLRIAGVLTAALLRTKGLDGLLTGLRLIHGYLETYWDSVYPLLDVSDGNDPTERLNAISNLAAPLGSDGDALRIIEGVRKVPIVQAPQAGSFTLEHYFASKAASSATPGSSVSPTPQLIEAALKEVSAPAISKTAGEVEACLAELNAIINVFKTHCGPETYPALDSLIRELRSILSWVSPTRANLSAAVSSERMENLGTKTSDDKATIYTTARLNGEITSREDVIRMVDQIIHYYKKYEPSSPVPFLLNRVRRLIPMDFLQLITELTPEATDKILLLTGRAEDKTNPGA